MLIKLFRRLLRQNEGSAVVEAALLFPLLALLVTAIAEIGIIMFVSGLTEAALRESSRYGITGQDVNQASRLDNIRSLISNTTLGLLDGDNAVIEVKTYPSFAAIDTGEPFIDGNGNSQFDEGETYDDLNGNGLWDNDIGVAGAGGSGAIVRYSVTVNWDVKTPMIKPFFSDTNGDYLIRASMAVRNEPWEN